MSALEKARAHYGSLQEKARLAAALSVRELLGLDIRITPWSNRAEKAFHEQWPAELRTVDWDWPDKMSRFKAPKDFRMVFWTPDDRLVGLAVATLNTDTFATLRFVEGDPRPCCPYKGKRALFALEATTNYVQASGREELRIQPLNETLASLYQGVYGFTPVRPRKDPAYFVKRV